MEWIRKHKIYFILSISISVIAAFSIIVWLKGKGAIEVEGWQVGLIALPWFTGFASFLPLLYLSWFGSDKLKIIKPFFKIFYWFFVFCVVLVWLFFYGVFVFKIL